MLAPLSASGWADSPPPERRWLIPALIPMGAVTLLSGDGGVGKSALMKQLGLAASLRTSWLGRHVYGGPVLGVFAEDDEDEVGRRLIRIAAGEGLDLAGAKDLLVICSDTLKAGAALATSTDGKVTATPLFAELRELIAEIRPVLVVLDPAAEIAAIDENRRSEVAAFIRLINGLAASSGAAIILIAHPSLTGMNSGSGLSGSTAWNNSVRSRLYLTAPDANDPDARRIALVKSNYARSGVAIDLRVSDGRFVIVAGSSSAEQREVQAKAEAVFLSILRRLAAEGRPVSASPSATYAPTVFAAEPEAKGLDRKALMAAMTRLFAAKRIEVIEEGSPSRRRKRLAEATTNAPADPPTNALPTAANGVCVHTPHTPHAVGNGVGVGTPAAANSEEEEGDALADEHEPAFSYGDDEFAGYEPDYPYPRQEAAE